MIPAYWKGNNLETNSRKQCACGLYGYVCMYVQCVCVCVCMVCVHVCLCVVCVVCAHVYVVWCVCAYVYVYKEECCFLLQNKSDQILFNIKKKPIISIFWKAKWIS